MLNPYEVKLAQAYNFLFVLVFISLHFLKLHKIIGNRMVNFNFDGLH